MNIDLEHSNLMTVAILIIAVIIVGIGGVAVITNNLTFETYLNDLEKFAIGVGIVAVGRGLKSGATRVHH